MYEPASGLNPGRDRNKWARKLPFRLKLCLEGDAAAHHVGSDPEAGPSGESHAGSLAMSDRARPPAPARIEETYS